MQFYLRLTHSEGRLDTLERLVDRADATDATDSAIRWLRLETRINPNLVDQYDTWAVHEATEAGAGIVIATGDATPLLAE